MSRQAIYEQVSAAHPGQPFKASGLYRLAGHVVNRRFVKATKATPLRTMADIKISPPQQWRCPMCLGYLPQEFDDMGRLPCPGCGYREGQAVAQAPGDFMVYAEAPDTLDLVVQRQYERSQGLPLRTTPAKVQMRRVALSGAPLTFTEAPRTLDRILTHQRHTGMRPPDPLATVRAMQAQPCERCNKTACACPPQAPDVLGATAARKAARLAVQEQTNAAAGMPPVR